MSYPTVFANLAAGNQPAALLDTMFNICGNQGNIPCAASGTNTILLTPNTNFFLPGAYVNYQMFSFVAAASSTGVVTVQVGALAALPLYTSQLVQASTGDISIGVTYTIVFNQALNGGAGGFQIIGISAAAALVPTGTEVPFAGISAPAGWYLSFGQAVSRTTDAALFGVITTTCTGNTHTSTSVDGLSVDLRGLGLIGAFIEGSGIAAATTITAIGSSTTLTLSQATSTSVNGATLRILPYGQGDYNGTTGTTFNVPDRRGRVVAARSDMGGTDNNLLSSINGSRLAVTGGEQTHILVTGELAAHTHANSLNDLTHTHGPGNLQGTTDATNIDHTHNVPSLQTTGATSGGVTVANAYGGISASATGTMNSNTTHTHTFGVSAGATGNNNSTPMSITNASAGSGTAHNNLQPMGISNMIIKR